MKKILTLVLLLTLVQSAIYAQVGIGTTNPNNQAILDLSSTTKGLLIPRMSSTQRTAISSPPKGLMVFDNDSAYFFYYDGSTWQALKNSASAGVIGYWSRIGTKLTLANTGDSVGIGKTPAYALDVKGPVNADSLMIGGNTMISTKGGNFLVGSNVGTAITTGIDNQFIGYQAGHSNTTGSFNQFEGYMAGYYNTTGNANQFEGLRAGYSNTTGKVNQFAGYNAGYSNTTGASNQFEGEQAGYFNTTGNYNCFSGYMSGYHETIGANNVAFGYMAGSKYNGTGNTFIGDSADASTTGLVNATAIGHGAIVSQSNSLVLGNGENVGIGTSTPSASAVLDLSSTTQGMLMPRMSSSNRTAINSPTNGLLVFDTDSGYVFFYNSGWKGIKSTASTTYWIRSGNQVSLVHTGDSVGIGKTPAYALDVQGPVNADSLMLGGITMFSTKGGNIFVGTHAGTANTTGTLNQFIGNLAGSSNTIGTQNYFEGWRAGYSNTSGNDNQFIGDKSGYSNTSGNSNQFSGNGAGYDNTTGSGNQFEGYGAGYSNTSGNTNQYIGFLAGYSNTTGTNNQFEGNEAGEYNTTGAGNLFIGFRTGYSNTTGASNQFTGYQAGHSNTTGASNLFEGFNAGYSNTKGTDNQFIGDSAGSSNTTGSQNQFEGYMAGHSNTTGKTNQYIGFLAGYSNTTGASNQFTGYQAGYSNTTGNYNCFSGNMGGYNETTGGNNVAFGYMAGYSYNGSGNTFMGDSADAGASGLVNATAIGHGAIVSQSNSLVLGNGANVGIGISTPNPSALLDLSSTSKGMLMPRMSSTNRTSIASPAKGLMVYDTDSGYVFFYNSGWKGLKSSTTNTFWNRTGTNTTLANSGDNVGIGKTPAYALDVKGPVNADSLMLGGNTMISNKGGNFLVGSHAGAANTTGVNNLFIGNLAGYSNTTGNENHFEGYQTGYSNTTGGQNNFEGYQTGYSNTTGGQNNFEGYQAGYSNSTGANNQFAGYQAGYSNTTGTTNQFTGYQAGHSNTTGATNQFTGYQAGHSNTTGANNQFAGYRAGFSNTTGNYNCFSGNMAGYNETTGANNVAFGYKAGYSYNGSENTFMGDSADASTNGLVNATAIGHRAIVGQSNSLILGNGANVGVGTSAPNSSALLDLTSTSKGMLIPRMSSSNRTAISSPATGLLVFDTDSGYVFFYNSGWKGLKSSTTNTFWNRSGTNTILADSGDNVGIGTSTPNSSLQVAGSISTNVKSYARTITPYDLKASDHILTVSTASVSNPPYVVLPDATTCKGREYIVKSITANAPFYVINYQNLIDNSVANYNSGTSTTYPTARFFSDGTNWWTF